MSLVSGAFFSILVNGSPSKPFRPFGGIKQGDPLSPFLFVIMVEGLSRILKATSISNMLTDLKLHNPTPTLTHQQFVDDTLLMGFPMINEEVAWVSPGSMKQFLPSAFSTIFWKPMVPPSTLRNPKSSSSISP